MLKKILWDMTDALAHRGPDGRGVFVDSFIGLGHRRLAVIDLSKRANQPMQTEDGNLIVTYSGEVYNFKDLRKRLKTSIGYNSSGLPMKSSFEQVLS